MLLLGPSAELSGRGYGFIRCCARVRGGLDLNDDLPLPLLGPASPELQTESPTRSDAKDRMLTCHGARVEEHGAAERRRDVR